MSLIIATGSNIGDPLAHLQQAKLILQEHFQLIAQSQVYLSSAIDYKNQPDFHNQVLEFLVPTLDPSQTMTLLLEIEKDLGRKREIPKGPRTIDIDLLLYGDVISQTEHLILPHPRMLQRSFVILPLKELPYYHVIRNKYDFDQELFPADCTPLEPPL